MGAKRPNAVENLGGVARVRAGTLEERPAAADLPKGLFVVKGGKQLFYSDGVLWDEKGGGSQAHDRLHKIYSSADHSDVDASVALQNGQTLVWDATVQKWKPGTVAGGTGGAHAASHYWTGSDPIDAMEIGALTATAPSINLQPDSGRFAGAINPLQQVASTFTGSGFWSSINGSTIASGGRFIQDNTSFGGTGGVLTQDVIDLLAAMGRSGSGARYGIEFFVQTVSAGTGTAEPWNDDGTINRYPVTQNGNRAIYGMGNTVSMAFWVRLKSVAVAGRTALIPAASKQYLAINGVAVPAGYKVLTLANGWTHVALYGSSAIGYNTTFPAISANSGDVVQIALPVVVPGKVRLPVHTAPVPTINGASA